MRCKANWSSQTVDRFDLSFSGAETFKDDEGDGDHGVGDHVRRRRRELQASAGVVAVRFLGRTSSPIRPDGVKRRDSQLSAAFALVGQAAAVVVGGHRGAHQLKPEIDLGVHQTAGMNAQNLHGAAPVHGSL
jgi:hypothetical protein